MTFEPSATQRIILKVRKRIIPRWKSRLKDYSTIALALGTAAVPVWAGLPGDLRAHLPVEYVAWAIGALNAFGLGGKFLIQGEPNADK